MFIRQGVQEIHYFCIFGKKWLFQLKIAIFKTKFESTHQGKLFIISKLIMRKDYKPWFTFKWKKSDKNSQKQPFLGIFAFTHFQPPPPGECKFFGFLAQKWFYMSQNRLNSTKKTSRFQFDDFGVFVPPPTIYGSIVKFKKSDRNLENSK